MRLFAGSSSLPLSVSIMDTMRYAISPAPLSTTKYTLSILHCQHLFVVVVQRLLYSLLLISLYAIKGKNNIGHWTRFKWVIWTNVLTCQRLAWANMSHLHDVDTSLHIWEIFPFCLTGVGWKKVPYILTFARKITHIQTSLGSITQKYCKLQ